MTPPTDRALTPTEQAIIRPLIEQRTALQRELAAIERGMLATIQALHGTPELGLTLDYSGETMRLRIAESPGAQLVRLLDDDASEPGAS